MESNNKTIEQTVMTMSAADDLRGRQSVRTTFKLSEATVRAVSIVAAHLGIKQKSLFDHLMDESTALETLSTEMQANVIAQGRVQKTYVISRRSLDCVERLSKNLHTSRDVVVEICVQRLLPIIAAERLQHEKRKEVLVNFKKQSVAVQELLKKTLLVLGDNDPVSAKIATAASAMETACRQIEDFVERGKIIEESHTTIIDGKSKVPSTSRR